MDVRHHVGLVGAGAIAEHHVAAVRGVPGAELVGVTDVDPARARAFATRFGTRSFPSIAALREAGTNAIHVLTPPDSHADVAVEALRQGCHVLVEKPLATTVEDCLRIADEASSRGLRASVDHSLLFDPQVVRALERVRSGELGRVVSVDVLRSSVYPPYPGGPLPPHYRGAAYPFRDLGVHAFSLLQAFLGPIEDVSAFWNSRGGDPNLAYDEWRTLVRCRDGLGQFQLSWNVKPLQSQLIVQGTRGVLRVDLFLMFHARRGALPVPKPVERVANAITDSVQPLVDVPRGVLAFATGRIRPFQGLHNCVRAFYRALNGEGPLPVELEEATAIVRWVERVASAAEADHAAARAALPCSATADVLVTGASGAVGEEVVRALRHGRRVRMFVRRMPRVVPPGVDVVVGDLGDADAVDRAVRGAAAVVHAGAAMSGGWEAHQRATVVGTRNVVEACLRHGVRKLVHVSSLSVADWARSDGGSLSEASPYEPHPDERGYYTRAKLEAERIVRAAAAERALPAVILRPGQIFGGRIPLLTPAVARRVAGLWVVLGDGEVKLPLVAIDDVVDAIVAALERPVAGGEIIHLVGPHRMTQNEVLAEAVADARDVVRVPRALVFAAGRLSEPLFAALGRKSPVSEYRLRSAMARVEFAEGRARELLGWNPRGGVVEALRRARQVRKPRTDRATTQDGTTATGEASAAER